MKPFFMLLICALAVPGSAAAETLVGEPRTVDLPCVPHDTALAADGTAYLLCDDRLVVIPKQDSTAIETVRLPAAYHRLAITPDGTTLLLHGPGQQQATEITLQQRVTLPVDGSPILGDPAAPVTITAFLDIQCPYCSRVLPTLTQLLQTHAGRVRLVIKHFPLRMHTYARPAAHAALAAARQNAYQPYLEALFANYRSLDDAAVQRFARQAGLDIERFNRDTADPAIADQVRRDLALGSGVGVRGVPAIFVSGVKAPSRSRTALARMIEQAATQP